MGKRLVITEKPSVAKDICAALGGFDDNEEFFENEDFVITFAVGHLLQLAEPEDYNADWKGWTIASLPIIPDGYKVKPKVERNDKRSGGVKKRLAVIKKLGKRDDIDGIINACDAGREGEIIFRRILEHMGLQGQPHQRLWLQSMTQDAIRDAFANLRPSEEYDSLGDAAWLRGVGDWLIGINATRALTKRLKGRRETGAWSAGRVQTPTLGLLVQREREILAHVPKTYWEVLAQFEHEGATWEGRYYDSANSGNPDRDIRPSRIFDRARVDQVVAAVAATSAAPANEKRKRSRQRPPLPFDLTSLQREANRRFSISAKRTLAAAQRLYEGHKLLTYPRTDSRYLPEDYGEKVGEILAALSIDADFQKVATDIVTNGPLNLDRILDNSKVSDHFAIVPTGAEPPDSLGADDSRIYDLVVRQFMASLMGPATWATVERHVTIPVADGDDAVFRTTARSLEIPGFLEALGQEAGAGSQLPALVPGQDAVEGVEVAVGDGADEEKETRPPARYSEGQLLRLMETAGERMDDEEFVEAMKGRGLGTPATRADTIERLVNPKVRYARRVDGKLGPTPKGIRLMDILERVNVPVLASATLTGQWESELLQVQNGSKQRSQVLDELETFTRNITENLAGFDHDALFEGDGDVGECPSCKQGRVIETAWGYRCQRNTQKDPECRFIIWKERGGRYVDRPLARKLILERRSGQIGGFVDRSQRSVTGEIFIEPKEEGEGAPWTMRHEYGPTTEADAQPEVAGAILFPCPCESDECAGVLETSRRYVCKRFYDGEAKKGPVLPKVVCQREMSLEEVQAFFSEEGRTEILDDFVSRRGRPFRGLLFRKPTGKHGFEFPPRGDGSAKKKKASKKRSAKKKAAKRKTTKKAAAKKSTKKAAAKKSSTKKAAAKKSAKKKPAAKRSAKKKPAAKRSAKKKPAAKKAAKSAPASTSTESAPSP